MQTCVGRVYANPTKSPRVDDALSDENKRGSSDVWFVQSISMKYPSVMIAKHKHGSYA